MKNYLMCVVALFVLINLAGCSSDNKTLKQSGNDIIGISGDTNEEALEVEKYKLTEGYIFDFSKEGEALITKENDYSNVTETPIEINGMLFSISRGDMDSYLMTYINETEGNRMISGGNIHIVDLNVNDNYKEAVVLDSGADPIVYRMTEEGFENITFYEGKYGADGIYKFNDKLYIPFYKFNERPGNSVIFERDVINEKVLTGYLIYEDNKFVYKNRFANGEKMTNNDGEFNENFKKETFKTVVLHAWLDEEEKTFLQIPEGTEIRFLKVMMDSSYSKIEYEVECCSEFDGTAERIVKGENGYPEFERTKKHIKKGEKLKCSRNDESEMALQQFS